MIELTETPCVGMLDSHCHVDEEAYADDRDSFLQRQKDYGIKAIVVPCVDRHSIDGIFAVCQRWQGFCFPTLGLHPQNVAADWEEQLSVLHHAVYTHTPKHTSTSLQCTSTSTRCTSTSTQCLDSATLIVALGEIGLDYHYERTWVEAQQHVLRTQLQWARELDLPVIIHSRDATADTIRIVQESIEADGTYPLRGVIHCFNGSREVAEQWINMGFYLGIGGVLTFKNCKLWETLSCISKEHLLLETDGPYLAPTPFRGQRNEPILMHYVAKRIAEIYDCPIAEIVALTTANTKSLFRLNV